jgi:hypothetical protein
LFNISRSRAEGKAQLLALQVIQGAFAVSSKAYGISALTYQLLLRDFVPVTRGLGRNFTH